MAQICKIAHGYCQPYTSNSAITHSLISIPGLKSRKDDAFLLRFLRAKKFDYDRAYQQLINYYQIRVQNEDVLKELIPSAVNPEALDAGVTVILPKKDKLGRKILYFRPGVGMNSVACTCTSFIQTNSPSI